MRSRTTKHQRTTRTRVRTKDKGGRRTKNKGPRTLKRPLNRHVDRPRSDILEPADPLVHEIDLEDVARRPHPAASTPTSISSAPPGRHVRGEARPAELHVQEPPIGVQQLDAKAHLPHVVAARPARSCRPGFARRPFR